MWFCMTVTFSFATADGTANVSGLQHDGHAGPRPQQLMPLPPRPLHALRGEAGELLIPAYFHACLPCVSSFLFCCCYPYETPNTFSIDKKHMDTHTICISCSALYASLSDVYLEARTRSRCLLALVRHAVISSKTKRPVRAHGEREIEEEPKTSSEVI